MKILIPHLAYTVVVKPTDGKQNYIAWVQRDTNDQCTVYIKQPVKRIDCSILAHELTHVLRIICDSRSDMTLYEEKEHMGYLMQYLMNKILGYEYGPTNKK